MKKIACEICGSPDLIKSGDFFECQSCGMKYKPDDIKKMMIEGKVDIKGTVNIDQSEQLLNFINLSKENYNSRNGQLSFDYANKALEISPTNYEAWLCKMYSIELISTLGDVRAGETITAGNNAIKYGPEEELKKNKFEVSQYFLKRANELYAISLTNLLDVTEVKSQYKSFMRIAPFSASQSVYKIDSITMNTYNQLAAQALEFILAISIDVLVEFPELVKLMELLKNNFESITVAIDKRLKIYGYNLSESGTGGKADRNSVKVKAFEVPIKEAKKRILENEEKERKEKIEKYWEENKELMVEIKKEIKVNLNKINEINKIIEEIPEHFEIKNILIKIKKTQKELKNLGLFKFKIKKELNHEINELKDQKDSLERKIKPQVDPLKEEIKQLTERNNFLENELIKDR